jgi:hypothetical protein
MVALVCRLVSGGLDERCKVSDPWIAGQAILVWHIKREESIENPPEYMKNL